MDTRIFKCVINGREFKEDPFDVEMRFDLATDEVDWDSILARFQGPDFLEPISDSDPRPKAYEDRRLSEDDDERRVLADRQVRLGLRVRHAAIREIAPVVCKVFRVPSFQDDKENGLTYEEALDLFTAWNEFQIRVKKNTDENASTPPSTEGDSPDPTTPNDSTATT